MAVAGLSVGGNIVAALARHGIGAAFTLADRDELATSNLNRTQSRMLDVGVPKCLLTARTVLELDPFATCVLHPRGLDDDSVHAFVASNAGISAAMASSRSTASSTGCRRMS